MGFSERCDGLHEQAALLHLNAFVQGLFGIVVQNGHCRLGEDGAGVNARIHKVDGQAGDLHAVGQGVTHAVRTREGGQQGGVGVNNAVAETLNQLRVNNTHEAGEHNVIGVVGSDLFFQRAVPGGAVGVVAGLHQEGGHTRRLGTLNTQTGLVGAHCRNVEGKLARCYSVEDGLKIRSGAGYHNHNSHPTSITRLTPLSKGVRGSQRTQNPMVSTKKPRRDESSPGFTGVYGGLWGFTGVCWAQTQRVANSIGRILNRSRADGAVPL